MPFSPLWFWLFWFKFYSVAQVGLKFIMKPILDSDLEWSSCFSLWSTEVTGMHHDAQPALLPLNSLCLHSPPPCAEGAECAWLVLLLGDCMHCLVRMYNHSDWESNNRGIKAIDSLSFWQLGGSCPDVMCKMFLGLFAGGQPSIETAKDYLVL